MLWLELMGLSMSWPLAQENGGELIYVIAVLILAGLGALADKIKKSKEQAEQDRMRRTKGSRETRKGPVPGRSVSAEPRPGREVTLPRRPGERTPKRAAPPTTPRPSRPPTRRPVPPPSVPVARAPAEAPPKGTLGATLSNRREGRHRTLQAGDSTTSSLLARESVRTIGMISGVGMGKGRRRQGIGSSWWLPAGRLTPAEMRRALILSEILQPPIALRDE